MARTKPQPAPEPIALAVQCGARYTMLDGITFTPAQLRAFVNKIIGAQK